MHMYFIIKKTLPCISQPGHPDFSCLIICAPINMCNFLLVFTMMEKCSDVEGPETFVRMKQVLKIHCYNIFSKFHVFHFYEIVM